MYEILSRELRNFVTQIGIYPEISWCFYANTLNNFGLPWPNHWLFQIEISYFHHRRQKINITISGRSLHFVGLVRQTTTIQLELDETEIECLESDDGTSKMGKKNTK